MYLSIETLISCNLMVKNSEIFPRHTILKHMYYKILWLNVSKKGFFQTLVLVLEMAVSTAFPVKIRLGPLGVNSYISNSPLKGFLKV